MSAGVFANRWHFDLLFRRLARGLWARAGLVPTSLAQEYSLKLANGRISDR